MEIESLPEMGSASQVLRLASGNLFVAFVLAFETMAVTRKEWPHSVSSSPQPLPQRLCSLETLAPDIGVGKL